MTTSLISALHAARAALASADTAEAGEAALARRLVREIDEAVARLEGGEAAKDLVSIVCHDLKDPLASIVMGAGFLRKTSAADEPSVRRVIEAIARSAERMTQVVSDFHDLAKIDSGVLPFDARPCDLSATVRAAIGPLEAQAREKGLTLGVEFDEEPVSVVGDRARLVQALVKLVGNALRFTPPGGRVVVRIQDAGGGRVRLSVADTGRGIAADRLPGIFEHASNARRTPRDGPGLGLPIVRGVAELHGSEVSVESRLGEGSTFSFTLARA